MKKKTELCPKCGREMDLALPPGGKGKRSYQCFDCDRPDPLKSKEADGYLRGLKPPE